MFFSLPSFFTLNGTTIFPVAWIPSLCHSHISLVIKFFDFFYSLCPVYYFSFPHYLTNFAPLVRIHFWYWKKNSECAKSRLVDSSHSQQLYIPYISIDHLYPMSYWTTSLSVSTSKTQVPRGQEMSVCFTVIFLEPSTVSHIH